MELWSLGVGFIAGAVVVGLGVWVVLSRMCDRRVDEAQHAAQTQIEQAMRDARDADMAHRETKERLIALQLEQAASQAEAVEVAPPAAAATPAGAKPAADKARASYTRPAANNLKRIRGIGRAVEKRLNGMGITTIKQVAELTEEQAKAIDDRLAFPGRVQREKWVEQAQTLLKEDAAGVPEV